eukprot:11011631-Alexandrium_andersonii.AAC.1
MLSVLAAGGSGWWLLGLALCPRPARCGAWQSCCPTAPGSLRAARKAWCVGQHCRALPGFGSCLSG